MSIVRHHTIHLILHHTSGREVSQESDKVINRMYAVNPSEQERYYLRIVLLHIPGATSYGDLQRVDDRQCSSFRREVCLPLGLLNDDTHWHKTLDEASSLLTQTNIEFHYTASGMHHRIRFMQSGECHVCWRLIFIACSKVYIFLIR